MNDRRYFGFAQPLLAVIAALVLVCASSLAIAANLSTITQSPALGVQLDMGSTQSITYFITNTSNGGDVGERIYQMRFRLNSGSTFSASTAAPAGWTRTAYSTTSVTFQATSWANAIAVGGAALGFTLVINMRTSSADLTTERLRDYRARYTATTTGPPFTQLASITTNTPGLWTLKSLTITSFQITDLSGTPLSAITGGASFQLRMTVRNNSNTTQNPVTANPNPPTANKVGTVTQSLTGTTGSPLNLASGASGTIIFTFSTAAADNGTISFTANAQRVGTVTSSTVTSGALSVSSLSASIAVTPACQYPGGNVSVAMTVTNGSLLFPVTGVTPSLSAAGGAPVTYVSGPTPATIASIPISGTGVFNWVYQVNSVGVTNPFTFSGSASGTRGGSPVSSLTAVSTPATTRGGFPSSVSPTSTNAGSSQLEVTFSVINSGCANVNSVAITIPSGWTYGGDAYSLVNLSAASAIETWTVSGASPIIFTAPNVAGQLPLTFGGSFSLVFSATPAAATTSVFTLRVTDTSGAFTDVPLSILVGAYKSGAFNNTGSRSWREDFR